MRRSTRAASPALLLLSLCLACGNAVPADSAAEGDRELIANALSAAPEHIAAEATVMLRGEGGQMRILRKGTGEFTCMPDNPRRPGNVPMCVDRAGRAWLQAMAAHREPPGDLPVSVAYMLQGSAFPSFDDPAAREPAAGEKWQETGPILMIMNVRGRLSGYAVDDPDPRVPFVMYRGTPYEHLMIPLGGR